MLNSYRSKTDHNAKLVMKIRAYTPANRYDNEHVNHLRHQSQNPITGLILRQVGYGTLHLPHQVHQRHGGNLQIDGLREAGMGTE